MVYSTVSSETNVKSP